MKDHAVLRLLRVGHGVLAVGLVPLYLLVSFHPMGVTPTIMQRLLLVSFSLVTIVEALVNARDDVPEGYDLA